MTRREWMEKNFGARPSKLPLADLQAKTKLLEARHRSFGAAQARARKLCSDTEKWDAQLETVKRLMQSRERPDT